MATSIGDEWKDIDQAVEKLFRAGNAQQREHALRELFVEKLDFTPNRGAISIPAIDGSGVAPAQIVAECKGATVIYVAAPSDTVPAAAIVRKLYQASKGTLTDPVLVCSTRDGRHWQFVYPRLQGDKEVLRKLSVQRGQPRRTFVDTRPRRYPCPAPPEPNRGGLRHDQP